MSDRSTKKVALTIAGLDPSGGAGIVADIKTFTTFGCFPVTAITSVTYQNTKEVLGAVHQSAESVRRQIVPIIEDFEVHAVKTGMLPTSEIILEVAGILSEYELKNVVVDPVVRSTSGFDLIDDVALEALVENLFPLSLLVTPNLPEAERICGMKIRNSEDIVRAGKIMHDYGAKNVLIKGGHLPGAFFDHAISGLKAIEINDVYKRTPKESGKFARDFLFIGDELHVISDNFIETKATHGTGCSLAAAIAAGLARGSALLEAVLLAKKFITAAIETSPNIGQGNPSINHSLPGFSS